MEDENRQKYAKELTMLLSEYASEDIEELEKGLGGLEQDSLTNTIMQAIDGCNEEILSNPNFSIADIESQLKKIK